MSDLYGWNKHTSGTRNNLFDIAALDFSLNGSSEGIYRGLTISTTGATGDFVLTSGALRVSLSGTRMHSYVLPTDATISLTSSVSGTTNYVAAKIDLTNLTASIEISATPFSDTSSPEVYYADLYTVVATGVSLTADDFTQTGRKIPALDSDWQGAVGTWSYSATVTDTRTAVITVPSGAASLYEVGMFVKFTQPTNGEKIGIISDIEDTTLYVCLQSGDTFENEAIDNAQYSSSATPLGVDRSISNWKVDITINGTQASPSAATWYELDTFTAGRGHWLIGGTTEFQVDLAAVTLVDWRFALGPTTASASNAYVERNGVSTDGAASASPNVHPIPFNHAPMHIDSGNSETVYVNGYINGAHDSITAFNGQAPDTYIIPLGIL